MDEKYKELSLDDLYEELINYNISIKELASIYGFPSENELEKALKNYCKKFVLPLPKQLASPEDFFTEQEEEIYQEYKKNVSKSNIAKKFGISIYMVNKILDRFEKVECKQGEDTQKTKSIDIEEIIKELDNGETYSRIMKKYKISLDKLKKMIKLDPRGEEILKQRADNKSRRKEISEQDAIDAFINNKYTEISPTTVRKRLREIYGDNYAAILRGTNNVDKNKTFADLYENGVRYEDIAKITETSISLVKTRISTYYKKAGIPQPKILSKEDFDTYVSQQKTLDVSKMVNFFEELNIHIPEPYIKQLGEIDLRKVKTIVNKEFAKLEKEDKHPNLVSPFQFADKLKSKGYNTKYQATALLYKIITENDLSTEIASELEDEEISEALHLLIDYDKTDKIGFLRKLEKTKIAQLIYTMQNQTSNPDTEKTIED